MAVLVGRSLGCNPSRDRFEAGTPDLRRPGYSMVFGRTAPDPVAFAPGDVAALPQSDFALIVGFVPTDRVEHKPAFIGAAVFEWFAVDNIVGQLADDDQLLAVNEALEKFSAVDERKAELVKLRYFVGLNFEEAAAALGIAVPTAKQWWAYARSWLTVEMRRTGPR